MFDVAMRSENDLLGENAELIVEQSLTYNYFGTLSLIVKMLVNGLIIIYHKEILKRQ
ncbi:hypothetical protein [Lentibacillus jeotgali]|uniref:hypothetical protein n=1 Tax=Lentibacillus jeotgali TaxID=558169 RepID=UPI0002FF84E4|nr:hypothetical protein [Lentibacillus jeotgali]